MNLSGLYRNHATSGRAGSCRFGRGAWIRYFEQDKDGLAPPAGAQIVCRFGEPPAGLLSALDSSAGYNWIALSARLFF